MIKSKWIGYTLEEVISEAKSLMENCLSAIDRNRMITAISWRGRATIFEDMYFEMTTHWLDEEDNDYADMVHTYSEVALKLRAIEKRYYRKGC